MPKNRLFVSVLAAALALGALSAAAQAQVVTTCFSSTQLPLDNQVILYEHAQYGGQCWVVTVTTTVIENWTEDLGIPNDTISSVKVGGRVQLVLYEHINNQFVIGFYGDIGTGMIFVPYVGDPANDKASSFAVIVE